MHLGKILEVKQTLSGERHEFQCDLLHSDAGSAAVLYRLPKSIQLHGVALRQGDLSIGYFWESRCYNVYHFLSCAGETRAFYLNICDSTRIRADRIFWRDLVVDILITSAGEYRVLDESELPANLEPRLAQIIADTCESIALNREVLQQQWRQCSEMLMRQIL